MEGMDTHSIPPNNVVNKSATKRGNVVMDADFNIKEETSAKSITFGCGNCGLNTQEWEDIEIPLTDIYF